MRVSSTPIIGLAALIMFGVSASPGFSQDSAAASLLPASSAPLSGAGAQELRVDLATQTEAGQNLSIPKGLSLIHI